METLRYDFPSSQNPEKASGHTGLIFLASIGAGLLPILPDRSAETFGEIPLKSVNNANPNPNMKRTLLFLILLLTFTWPSLAGLASQSLTFDDLGLGGGTATSGTYNSNDTFSFDVLLTFENYSATGLSFWLETNTAFAGSLSITGVTYGTAFPNHQ